MGGKEEVEEWRAGTDSDQAAGSAPWGGASLSCVPAAHKPESPQLQGKAPTSPTNSPRDPSRPQPAPAGIGPRVVPTTRGFRGTAGGDQEPGTAMAKWSETCGEKRLQEALRSQWCLPRFTRGAAGSGLRAGLCGADAEAAEGAGAAAAGITAAPSGAAAAVSEAAAGRSPLLRLPALRPQPPWLTAGPPHVTAGPPPPPPTRGRSAALRLAGEGVWQPLERPRGRV